MSTEQVKDAFTPQGKARLTRILQLLQEADREFRRLNDVENATSLDFHTEGSSLNHCIRWGLNAAQDLNEAVGNPEPPQLLINDSEVEYGVLTVDKNGIGHETFPDERARTLWCAEQDSTFDDFVFLDVQGQVTNYGIASTGKDALEDIAEDELDVYVVVTGEATDPEDESLPGAYLIQVSLKKAVVIENLTDEQQSAIAKAVLDSFHDHQGIEELDPFSIVVHLSNGDVIEEDSELEKPSKIVVSADHCGKVSLDQVPFEFDGKDDLMDAEADDAEFGTRVEALPQLQRLAGTCYTLYLMATKAILEASGDATDVDWDQVHQDVFAKAVGPDKQPVDHVVQAIKQYSPGAITPEQIAAVEAMGVANKRDLTLPPGWSVKKLQGINAWRVMDADGNETRYAGHTKKQALQNALPDVGVRVPHLIKVRLENESGKEDVVFTAAEVLAYHGETRSWQEVADDPHHQHAQMSLAEDYALYHFRRRHGDNGDYRVDVLEGLADKTAVKATKKNTQRQDNDGPTI